jgi:transcriptional regulator with XRE-family HTH domain
MRTEDPGRDLSTAVAGEVRALMARRQVKQKALAAATGMSQPALSRRLSGELSFDMTELGRVLAHLGEEPTALIERAQNLKLLMGPDLQVINGGGEQPMLFGADMEPVDFERPALHLVPDPS